MTDPDPERGDSIQTPSDPSEHGASSPAVSPPVSQFSRISIADSKEGNKWTCKQMASRIKGIFSKSASSSRPPSISGDRPQAQIAAGNQDKLSDTIQKNYRQTVLRIDADDSITVNLASLHRIRLLHLQQQLVRQAFKYHYSTVDSDDLDDPTEKESIDNPGSALHEYTEALRDWEFMKQCALRGTAKDPFVLSSGKLPDYWLIKDAMKWFQREYVSDVGDDTPYTISPDYSFIELTTELSWQDAEPVGGTRGGENRNISQNMRLQRVFMALIGGFFLVGPMLLMVLVNTRTASLITSSLCVLVFGLVMAAFFLERPFDVLSGTAAYAAVLVVFVGTSLES